MHIHECTFDEIEPIWRDKLWPGRKSPIEPTSAINHLGEINIDLLNAPSIFLKAVMNDKVVGVVSGQVTSETRFRSRGLWVDEGARQLGIGRSLISSVESVARDQKKSILWTMPRETSLNFYIKCGFREYKRLNEYEFGPHCLVEKNLK